MPRFESDREEKFWEVEQTGDTVETCEGLIDAKGKVPKTRSNTHPNEDEARYAAMKLITRKLRRGWTAAGASRVLGGGDGIAPPPPPSAIALDEYFAAGSDQFVPELLRATAAGKLATLADRWFKDARPWARAALLAYIDDGCDRPLHKGLVKRLFKAAEAAGDDEAMAHFMVAFDQLARRMLIKRTDYSWDRVNRKSVSTDRMEMVQDITLPGRLVEKGKPKPKDSPVFSRATRRYLARRAYRYFRKLGHQDVARYGKAMRLALPLYRDAQLSTVSKLLDAWGLLHVLYAWSDVLVRSPRGIRLADGRSLVGLYPRPHFPAAWTGVFRELLELAMVANSRPVRGWAISMLRVHHAADLAALEFRDVKRLITSDHDEPLVLGAELLAVLRGLETLPLTEWLELLAVDNLDVLPNIAALAERLLSPARLTLEQCIALATGKTAPVATLGLTWAKTKPIARAEDLAAIARLARAGVRIVRDDGTRWAAGVIAGHALARPEHIRDLCDGPFADARAHALAIVDDKFAAHPALWFALTESPYDDVRTFVLSRAAKWRDEAPPATLRHVWTTALLAVHTGSTVKARVPRQIAERIAGHPDEARALLPVLGYALRSVRPAERALGLAALVRAVRGDAGLRALSAELLPELTVTEQVSS